MQPAPNKHATIKTSHHANVGFAKGLHPLVLSHSSSSPFPPSITLFFNSLSLESSDVDVKRFTLRFYTRVYIALSMRSPLRSPSFHVFMKEQYTPPSPPPIREMVGLDARNMIRSEKLVFDFATSTKIPDEAFLKL